jgi:signal transduction histidine kinase
MVLTMPGGLRNRIRAHALIGDVIIAAALAAASVWFVLDLRPGRAIMPLVGPLIGGVAAPGRTGAAAVVLLVLACLPVALRRRWPFALLCLAQLPPLALVLLGHGTGWSLVASLVLLYSVAAHRGLAVSALAAGLVTGCWAAAIAGVPSEQWAAAGGPPGRWAVYLVIVTLMFAVWVVGRSVRLRRAYLAELEDRAERLERAGEADRRAAMAEERSRIARELHDVVAHHVSVMTVQAVAARRVLSTSPETAAGALSAIEEMGRAAMAEMRNIVGVLRTEGDEGGERAPQPGVRDLPALVEQMREAGLRTQLWIEGDESRLPPGLDLAAYRLIQEALTNSLRHAGAGARAWVTVRREPATLTVHVEDDGRGPAAEPRHPDRPGHGLVGIRERVALYGGMLQTGPRQGGGFEVRARFPLKTGK